MSKADISEIQGSLWSSKFDGKDKAVFGRNWETIQSTEYLICHNLTSATYRLFKYVWITWQHGCFFLVNWKSGHTHSIMSPEGHMKKTSSFFAKDGSTKIPRCLLEKWANQVFVSLWPVFAFFLYQGFPYKYMYIYYLNTSLCILTR